MDVINLEKELSNIDISDYTKILRISRKYCKETNNLTKHITKIAILGSGNIQFIVSVLKTLLVKYHIWANIYEGPYNGIKMDLYDSSSDLYNFAPDYLIILPDYHDFNILPKVLANQKNVYELVSSYIEEYKNMFNKVHKNLPNTQILCGNIISPIEDPLGNLSGNYIFSSHSFYKLFNLQMILNKPVFVTLLDIESLATYLGKNSWFDEIAYFTNKSTFAIQYIGQFCNLIAQQINSLKGNIRKCLILDLDNTLWGGVVGDDSYNGILVDPNDPIGEAYLAFQKYIIKLKERGIILAVCSKNDIENAREPFDKNEHMLLKYTDFSYFVANWDDKVSNIKAIAKKLNIGTDSLVFFDDNPVERELVKTYLPEVYTIDVPKDPALYIRMLNNSNAFEWLQITEEDLIRSDSYIENTNREELKMSYSDYNDYLKALELRGNCKLVNKYTISRFSQLINKSNQFNLRSQRYTEALISEMLEKPDIDMLAISLQDKFSNYGIIACVILRYEKTDCIIDNWVMSCRVLKKGVENYTLTKILDFARKRKCKRIIGEYIPTVKNKIVSSLFEMLGFINDTTYISGQKTYHLVITKSIHYEHNIMEVEQ